MDRRDFLAGTAASLPLALAGCLGSSGDGGGDGDATQTPESTTDDGPLSSGDEVSLSGDRALTVADFDASAFVVSKDGSDRTVHSAKTTRYVHVALKPDGIDDREAFAADNVTLHVNDESFTDPVFPLGGGPSQYVAAYPVPTDVTPYTASVEVDTGDTTATWELDARAIEDITQSVDYAVSDVSLPEAVEPGATFTADLTVSNAGDAMEFVVQYEVGGSTGRESYDVPAGEETTLELELTAPSTTGDSDDLTVALDWGGRSVSETVAYETTTSS
ncbi:hypothetical protein [Halobacterium jilantaiense]|uniref:CARDB protein n=1 Tax=Halobacterium jilantaiense TaxID=355548 RepID=A0A1I0NTD6_9EURY|nr:hypothetical protein [Halobacterium jilantaiense]SEW04881.1 hypothetical protein SAMN04487945_1132 [Halobacterium jilantaiense]